MRFRLLETTIARDGLKARKSRKEMPTTWPFPTKILDKYNALTGRSAKIDFIEEMVIPHPKFKNLFGLRQMIIDCILYFGLDVRKNQFLRFLGELNPNIKIPNKQDRPKMQYVFDSWKNKKLALNLPVLQNPSLYSRSFNEFKYTLNAFNLFSQPSKVSQYLRNGAVANVTQFLKGGTDLKTSEIKEGGHTGKKGDTIFNVIEGWANATDENGQTNEYSPDEIAERNKKDKEQWSYKYLKSQVETAFQDNKIQKPLGEIENYLNRLYATFELPLLKPESNENTVSANSPKDVKSSEVSKFGKVNEFDTPIYLTLMSQGEEIPGAFLFNQFVPLDEKSLPTYQTLGKKNFSILKSQLETSEGQSQDESPLQRLINTISRLEEIPNK